MQPKSLGHDKFDNDRDVESGLLVRHRRAGRKSSGTAIALMLLVCIIVAIIIGDLSITLLWNTKPTAKGNTGSARAWACKSGDFKVGVRG